MWSFLDYVCTHRSPLFLLLMPLIRCKLIDRICSSDQEFYYQQQIKQKLQGRRMPSCRSKGQMLVALLTELKVLKEDLISQKSGTDDKKQTESSFGHRLSFAISSAFQAGSKSVAVSSPPPSGTPSIDPSSPFEKTGSQSLTRVFSFREKPKIQARGLSVKLPTSKDSGNRKVVERFMRRTSYPYNMEEASSTIGINVTLASK